MKNLNSIDCLKLIMAFAVIAILVSAICETPWPAMFNWFIRQAVPFFFITSGFLIARKSAASTPAERSAIFRRQSLKLARLYGKWLLVYLPIALYYFIGANPRPLEREIIQYGAMVILDGESPYAWPLWFIYSMAIVLFSLSLPKRLKRPEIAGFAIFAAIYLINSIEPTSLLLKVFDRLTVRSLGGGIYICAGMILYQAEELIMNRPILPAILLALSISLFFLEIPFSPLLGGCGLFALGLMVRPGDSPAYLHLRAASMWVYYIHMIVLFPLIVLKNSNNMIIDPYVALGYGIAGSLVFAAILMKLRNCRGFGWLSNLIN